MKNILQMFSNKFLIGVTISYIVTLISLYVFIPYKMHEYAVDLAEDKTKSVVNLLLKTKEYYAKYVVDDIYNINGIKFSTEHKDNNTIPYPATFMHDVASMIDDPNLRISVYSNFPFKNQSDRVLTKLQLKVLKNIKGHKELFLRTEKDGTDYLTYAKTEYMTNKSCVQCHNHHPLKTWDFKWKIGDARGVTEATIPINDINDNIKHLQLFVLFIVSMIMLISGIIYIYSMIKIKERADFENEKIADEYSKDFSDLMTQNDILNTQLTSMHSDFEKHVIFTKTNLFGVIVDVSSAFCKTTGYSKTELLGEPHNIIRHPDMNANVFKKLWETIEADKNWVGEIKSKKKNGGAYWSNNVISPYYDKDGVKIGYISIKQDITEKKIKQIEELKNKLRKK